MRITVFGSRELQAVILALKTIDRATRREIRVRTKSIASEAWASTLRENANTRLEHRVLVDTARVRVSDQNVTLTSATVGRPLAGGLKPKENAAAVEFGAADRAVPYDAVSRRGRRYRVTKRNTRAQLKGRNRKGYVVYPSAAEIIPRIAALWTQTVARTLYDMLEGRSRG